MADETLNPHFASTRDGGIRIYMLVAAKDPEEEYDTETVFTLSKSEADALVIEHLRGPMGPVGPTGPMGVAPDPADQHRCPARDGMDQCQFWRGHTGRHQIMDGRIIQGSA